MQCDRIVKRKTINIKARALAGGRRRVVGGEGRGRGVGGDGAMAMGCWLRGRSAWEEDGVQGEGRGVECGRLGAKALRGTRGIRGHARDQSRGIRGHHAGSGGAARGPGRWAMRGLSTGGLGAKGLFRTRPEIPKEPVQSSASSSHVFLARPGIPKESVQSSLALFPYGARASFLIGSQS